MTEAVPLLKKLEELVYEATTERPFFGFEHIELPGNEDYVYTSEPTEAGEAALAAIKALLVDVQDALY